MTRACCFAHIVTESLAILKKIFYLTYIFVSGQRKAFRIAEHGLFVRLQLSRIGNGDTNVIGQLISDC